MEDYPFLTEALVHVLQKLRTDAGFSKRRLAAVAGIDRVYLLQVEQGKYRPTMNFIFLLARGLGIPATELVALIEREQKRLCEKDGEI